MEYPVCLADSCVGTLYVCPRGEETELRAVCRGTEKGLYRLYVQGNRGEVLLGVTETVLLALLGSGYNTIATFAIMLVFLLVRPQGIAGSNIQEKA